MEETHVSETIQMLIERMETHPEEFVRETWDPVQYSAWDDEPFAGTRWGKLIKATMMSGKGVIFTEAEVEKLQAAYQKLLHSRMEACIVKELIDGNVLKEMEFRDKQMELPYVRGIAAGASPSRTIKYSGEDPVLVAQQMEKERLDYLVKVLHGQKITGT